LTRGNYVELDIFGKENILTFKDTYSRFV